jgi:hypothetical protein
MAFLKDKTLRGMCARTRGKRLFRNCAWHVKACSPLKIEGVGERKQARPLYYCNAAEIKYAAKAPPKGGESFHRG